MSVQYVSIQGFPETESTTPIFWGMQNTQNYKTSGSAKVVMEPALAKHHEKSTPVCSII